MLVLLNTGNLMGLNGSFKRCSYPIVHQLFKGLLVNMSHVIAFQEASSRAKLIGIMRTTQELSAYRMTEEVSFFHSTICQAGKLLS